jgi:hypothetical protein
VGTIRWPNVQGIKLISEQGFETTIIDADSAGSGITIPVAVDTTTLIRGFTIQNGYVAGAPVGRGGGICCSTYYTSPTIAENKLMHCFANLGGGISVWGGSPKIKNNIICNNTAEVGGGIYLIFSSGTVINNIIELNAAPYGAGITPSTNTATIRNNVIRHNYGHGMYIDGIDPYIDSCTIHGNTGDGIWSGGGVAPTIHYCNICSNEGYGVTYNETVDTADAEYNWWGDPTGPWNQTLNPDGLGDEVGYFVDFIPWLDHPVSIEESPVTQPLMPHRNGNAVIVAGALPLSLRNKGNIYNSLGRRVAPCEMRRGVYFVDIEGKGKIKIIKVR